MVKSILRGLLFCALFCSSGLAAEGALGTSKNPLHVVMLDACLLPENMNFLSNKHVVIDLITSAKPALKYLFTPRICTVRYNHAVGPLGKVVSFHSRFLGKKMEEELSFKTALNEITAKRGPVHLVIANTSDLATYMSSMARKHLGIAPANWEMGCLECFYDKLVMKETLVRNDPGVRTAPFIPFDAPEYLVLDFVQRTPFPLILKKRRSAGSVGIVVITNQGEFERIYSKVKDKQNFLLERFIKGQTLRVQGEKVDGQVEFTIPSFNRTSPLDHYQGGKSRITTTIDENEIPLSTFKNFTDRVLNALQMRSGTFHLEVIHSDEDKELYFLEIAARPGEGNMDGVYRDLHHYDPRRAFYFRQIPTEFLGLPEGVSVEQVKTELFDKPQSRSENGDVYAVLTYPFQDASRSTFQNVTTNLHPTTLSQYTQSMKTFKGCDFDEHLAASDPHLLGTLGVKVYRYAFQVCIKAVSCHFEGPRDVLEKELSEWQQYWHFNAESIYPALNYLVPRDLLMAGGL